MNRLLLVLGLGVFASSISWRVVDPILPVLAADLGVSLGDVVLLSSAYSFSLAVMLLVFGPIGDAWGRVRVIRVSLAMVACSLLVMAIASTFPTMLAARVVSGAFAGGINPISIALISERIPLGQRQAAMGKMLAAMISGQMLGAAASGILVDLLGWRTVFALAAVAVTGVLLLNCLVFGSAGETQRSFSIGGALKSYRAILVDPASWLILGALFCGGMLVLGLIPFVGGMLLDHGAQGSAAAGIVIGAFAIGGIVFGSLVRPVLAVLGPWHMIRTGGVLVGASLMASSLPLDWSVIAFLFFLVGFGFYMFHNTIQLRVTELAPSARGSGISVGVFTFWCGQGLGPVVWAVIARVFGYPVLFFVAGALVIALGFIVASRLRVREHMPVTA